MLNSTYELMFKLFKRSLNARMTSILMIRIETSWKHAHFNNFSHFKDVNHDVLKLQSSMHLYENFKNIISHAQ